MFNALIINEGYCDSSWTGYCRCRKSDGRIINDFSSDRTKLIELDRDLVRDRHTCRFCSITQDAVGLIAVGNVHRSSIIDNN